MAAFLIDAGLLSLFYRLPRQPLIALKLHSSPVTAFNIRLSRRNVLRVFYTYGNRINLWNPLGLWLLPGFLHLYPTPFVDPYLSAVQAVISLEEQLPMWQWTAPSACLTRGLDVASTSATSSIAGGAGNRWRRNVSHASIIHAAIVVCYRTFANLYLRLSPCFDDDHIWVDVDTSAKLHCRHWQALLNKPLPFRIDISWHLSRASYDFSCLGVFSTMLNRVPLRLMPLGGSITMGVGSSDGNGYRKTLVNLLRKDGFEVAMVGSRSHGDMHDRKHEGWRGFRIDQIQSKARLTVPKTLPNVVTVNAGSNDCLQNFELEHLGERMGDMLDGIWTESQASTIILSTLVVNADEEVNMRIMNVNRRLRRLVVGKEAEGRRIILADMCARSGLSVNDLCADRTHPDDKGYEKMAAVWLDAVREAARKGLIQLPESP